MANIENVMQQAIAPQLQDCHVVPHRNEDTDTPDWYLVYTKPKQEKIALLNLQHQGFNTYLPLYKNLKGTPGGDLFAFDAMFPRYVFFQPVSAQQSISTARSTRGVVSIVSFGHVPALIKPDTLLLIKQFEDIRNNAELAVVSPMQPGKLVRFKSCALKGLQGLVQSVSKKRVAVLLALLGQDQLIYVEHSQLEQA